MHTDARELEDGTLIEGDLCIVGAGAAGISMALEWAGTSHDVILLEGGGFEVEAQMQDRYRGEIVGQPYFPLNAARLHAFGGTTGHWAGFCAPYDPIDFEEREWVPHSGWPIGREELDPFYQRAHELVELGPYAYDAAYWTRQDSNRKELPLSEEVVRTKMWQFSPPTRFGHEYRDGVTEANTIRLYTYANAVEVEANESVRAVEGIRVKTPNGKEHRVSARRYVLACGAIQNARLLLASNRQAPEGLGNDHDLVGRYFMEHIEMPGAQLVLAEPRPLALYRHTFFETTARGEVALTAEAQRTRAILNGTASLNPGVYDALRGTFQQLTPEWVEQNLQLSPEEMERRRARSRQDTARQPAFPARRAFKLFTRQEQAPNPHSRVTLTDEADALGMPRVALDWQLTALDKRSMRTFYEVLGQEVGRSGLGRVRLLEWLQDDEAGWPDFVSGGWHHMGTVRMHDDPRQGVVDANSKVHGIGNLYVAGSAVYPTAGAANPTLTLIALTLRLSDHLKATAD
jgi:choline dehydrogenase-like flavoprotein